MGKTVPFPPASRSYLIRVPGRLSGHDALAPLYERAIASLPLVDGSRHEFERLLRDGRTMSRVAVDPGGSPIGLAIGSPVAAIRELAVALGVGHMDAHVPATVSRGNAWALLVAVGPFELRRGIGRVLAGEVLAAMRIEACTRVYVAVRTGADHWLHARLHASGFSRDGITKDGARVVLSRKTDDLAF